MIKEIFVISGYNVDVSHSSRATMNINVDSQKTEYYGRFSNKPSV